MGRCGDGKNFCDCENCANYRLISQIKKSGKSCSIVNSRGFLKQACFDSEQQRTVFYKCASSEVSYKLYDLNIRYQDATNHEVSPFILGLHVSALCPGDLHGYQTCGLFDSTISDSKNRLCGGYLKKMCSEFYLSAFNGSVYKYKECEYGECRDNGNCSVARDGQDHNDSHVSLCDDKCDDANNFCSDESQCNGYRYGISCYVKLYDVFHHITATIVCDDAHKQVCPENFKKVCVVSDKASLQTCDSSIKKNRGKSIKIPLFNFTRCSYIDNTNAYPCCVDYLDQTNCSDPGRVGGRCVVRGYLSSVSKYVICDYKYFQEPTTLCDDGLQNTCISSLGTDRCKFHKHKLCNGQSDCVGKEDEFNDDCYTLTQEFSCERSFFLNRLLPIPSSWVMDGVRDCMNGKDEDITQWSFCGKKGKFRRMKQPSETCRDVYVCSTEDSAISYVRFDSLCDGVESCGGDRENRVCWIARDFPGIKASANRVGSVLDLCEGLKMPVGGRCHELELGLYVFGVEMVANLRVPSFRMSCKDRFGEYYVYLSCLDLCSETTARCLLKDMPLEHDSCPGQFSDRVYTLANNSYLTFARESKNGYRYTRYFQCNNKKCVEYEKVCNLVDDCGDASDEAGCINHVVCQDTANNSKKHFISIDQKCDGRYDCFDFSDECNSQCGREIFEGYLMKIISWTVGILAVVFNTMTFGRGIFVLRSTDIDTVLINQSLANVIAFGDLLTGIYLITLSVYDSFVYGKQFCQHQAVWLTSITCSVLGVISTLGSQLSLFAMTLLSFIRALGLIGKQLRRSTAVDKIAVTKATMFAGMIVGVSLVIAVVPLMSSLEDYFVQGMFYDPEYKVFIGFPDKSRHLKTLAAYFRNASNDSSSSFTEGMTWSDIGMKVDEMFSSDYGRLARTPVHFYGNDGVCLFKYFIRSDDARRSRNTLENMSDIADHKGTLIVWLMLGVNFVCVIAISICYSLIVIFVQKTSAESGSNQDPLREKEMKSMQNRIAFMIFTDFFTWTPFILISALHNLKVIDATQWYIIFAVILLPVNSFINPLIYDNKLRNSLISIVSKAAFFWGSRQNRVDNNNGEIELQDFQNRADNEDDEIELDDVQNRDENEDDEIELDDVQNRDENEDDEIELDDVQNRDENENVNGLECLNVHRETVTVDPERNFRYPSNNELEENSNHADVIFINIDDSAT